MPYQTINSKGLSIFFKPLRMGNPTGEFVDINVDASFLPFPIPPLGVNGGHVIPCQQIKCMADGTEENDAVTKGQLDALEAKIDDITGVGHTGATGADGLAGHTGATGADGLMGHTGAKGPMCNFEKKNRFWIKITSEMPLMGKIQHPELGLLKTDEWVVYSGGCTPTSWVAISENYPTQGSDVWGYKVASVDTYICIVCEPISWYV